MTIFLSRLWAPHSALLCVLLVLAGCGSLPRNGVPPALISAASIPGMPGVRAPSGIPSPVMKADMAASFAQEAPEDFPANDEGIVLYPHLALSGGGANGAFGAGFLNGWSSTGGRPTFKVVTGVSTGALMAPFAFLGQPGDAALHEFYTTTASRDIFALGEFLDIFSRVLFGEGIADTSPLVSLLERHVDETVLQQVALAHNSGRRLYIGTVDLDSQRFIIWNMGLIATSDQPDALQLFRKVMLASASIPIAFSPVFFDVEAGGTQYDEMHVDGAVVANVFYNGGLFSSRELRLNAGRETAIEDIYVIHNGQLTPKVATTSRTLTGIAWRSFQAAGTSATVGALTRIYAQSKREGSEYHWTNIADDVILTSNETFDPVAMQRLYDIGYQAALAGPVWNRDPPGVGGKPGIVPVTGTK